MKQRKVTEKDVYFSTLDLDDSSFRGYIKKSGGFFGFIKKFFFYLFPVLVWIRKYKFIQYLKFDVIAGITTSIAVIAQALVRID